MATIQQIGDRLHAINQRLTTVKPFRYYEPAIRDNSAHHPAIYFRIGQSSVTNDTARSRLTVTRTYTLVALIGGTSKAVDAVTVQQLAEPIIDEIEVAYASRPRLELNYQPLAGILEAEYVNSSGLTVVGGATQITFTLSITSIKKITVGA